MPARKPQLLREPSRYVLSLDEDLTRTPSPAAPRRTSRGSAPPPPSASMRGFEERKAALMERLRGLQAQGLRRAGVLLGQVQRLRPDETVGALAEPVGQAGGARQQRKLAASHVLTEAMSRLESIEKTVGQLTGGDKRTVEISMTSLSNFVAGDGRTIFQATRNSAPVGTRVVVSVNLKNMTSFETEARVAFVRRGKTPGVGLELDDLPPSARAAVAMFGQFRDPLTREEAAGEVGQV